MKFCIKDFFSKCNQTRSFLRIWSHLLKKSFMENFIFCALKERSSSNNQSFSNKNDISEDYCQKRFKGADAMLENLEDQ